ncbi:hypothetical protein Taro_004951 [Colocasia esculenta]|uniref:Uncharacterized protein n=1 Tax=Colocasia esculenta TaxID=4460 RepID=A0A843TNJ7_COLES|nr:hypothetical protein [Colocasia esculenta]
MQNTVYSPCRYFRVLGYNQLVDHVGTHGQRRLIEALNKDSLVRQKEYPTESSSKSRESVYIETCARRSRGILEQWSVDNGRQIATESYEDRDRSVRSAARTRRGALSRSDRDRFLCRDGPENAAYRAVAFSSASPEFEREKV